ncbi:MAG: TolC family protein [Bacteroidales bacterium]|nr:TolC family protein [Bacteroidales bacterium]
MKTKIILFILGLLFGGATFAQDMLIPYLETAARNNPGLKARFNEYMASLERVDQVGVLPDPQIAFGYFIEPVETRNGPQQFKISLNQMFPWFGSLGAREDVAASRARAAYAVFEDHKAGLYFEVKSTYYDLYFLNKGIDIIHSNIRILESFRALALNKLEAGKGSGTDPVRVEMELADLENDLAVLRDRLSIYKLRFNNLLNIDANSDILLPDSLWSDDLPYSRQDIMDSMRLKNYELERLDHLIASYREDEQVAKKAGMPSISLGVDYISIGKTDNSMIEPAMNGRDAILFPKIGISIPLYRKKYTAMANEALYMQKASAGRKEDKVNALEVSLERAYYEYEDSRRRITLFQKQKDLARQAMDMLQSEYASQGKNFEEILRMERRLLKYSLELERAFSDKQASVAFINYLISE